MKKENFNLGSITKKDIELISKYTDSSCEELEIAKSISDNIDKIFPTNELTWNKMVLVAFAFKLGEIQGKRQERSKKGGVVNA